MGELYEFVNVKIFELTLDPNRVVLDNSFLWLPFHIQGVREKCAKANLQ